MNKNKALEYIRTHNLSIHYHFNIKINSIGFKPKKKQPLKSCFQIDEYKMN